MDGDDILPVGHLKILPDRDRHRSSGVIFVILLFARARLPMIRRYLDKNHPLFIEAPRGTCLVAGNFCRCCSAVPAPFIGRSRHITIYHSDLHRYTIKVNSIVCATIPTYIIYTRVLQVGGSKATKITINPGSSGYSIVTYYCIVDLIETLIPSIGTKISCTDIILQATTTIFWFAAQSIELHSVYRCNIHAQIILLLIDGRDIKLLL